MTSANTTAAAGDGVAPPPQPEVATRGRATISVTVVLLVLLGAFVAASLMSSWVEDRASGGRESKGAEPVEQALGHGTPGGFNSRMDTFRAWAKLALMKLRRPHSDEPRPVCSAEIQLIKETMEQAAASRRPRQERRRTPWGRQVTRLREPAPQPMQSSELKPL
ncbi:hypothetical protein GUJ93_ZPchr0003g16886 [Zizania palustris]|uniref:Uncharacterized protein n=1 Tax=Zizania palustris TaxID=103762 RepID=A0A8J5VEE2_ZIZPA|nr:hypothetical protein GUJ93_ZPchr0003g16886 [Zizania palustris]